ncbi:glycoside hydrolase family protein [Actinacidiphila sp. DG2A-62]|uniref:glycoside hydrolase family protein n=1 Tax=Actinacidiphila sp. DG2A-62 TaxID=3108821 RepID=UPI002DBEE665|nr:glycoside hydrolase family protein [Actinacidiphila sp. DG2A-62]MEC3992430.1 glycoside hydrolase family protein [Actinacidiphila sp. DG2A-62]
MARPGTPAPVAPPRTAAAASPAQAARTAAAAPPRRLWRLLAVALILLAGAALRPQPAHATGAAGTGAGATAGRKGVSVTSVTGASQALADVGAHWYYDWATTPGGVTAPAGTEFVPMIWGAASVTDAGLAQARQNGTELLGFNEPDLSGQAQMSVQQALDLWPRLESTGLRLGAPAVAYGGDTPGGWLDQFMSGAAARGYRVDFIPLHWYGGDFSSAAAGELRGYLQAVYDRYHKPIWLTEYALTDFSGSTPRYPSAQQQADFVRSSAAMLDTLPFVEKSAWFTLSTGTAPTGLYTGTVPNSSGVAYRSLP